MEHSIGLKRSFSIGTVFALLLCVYWIANQEGRTKAPSALTNSAEMEAMNQKADSKVKELLLAITKGDKSAVQRLIKGGADVNATDQDGRPLLHYAATNRKSGPSIVTALLNAGAEVNATDSRGSTALLTALDPGGSPAIIRALVEAGTDLNKGDLGGDTPLIRAASWDDSVTMGMLLDRGADPNKSRRDGRTALMIAAQLGHRKAVEILLHHGADATAIDAENRTALLLAEEAYSRDKTVVNDYERKNRKRIVKLLREAAGRR